MGQETAQVGILAAPWKAYLGRTSIKLSQVKALNDSHKVSVAESRLGNGTSGRLGCTLGGVPGV